MTSPVPYRMYEQSTGQDPRNTGGTLKLSCARFHTCRVSASRATFPWTTIPYTVPLSSSP